MSTFREKYLKYKMKYIQLKKQLGGVCNCGQAESNADCPVCRDAMPAAAAVGNAGDINVTVVSMSGKSAIFPISRNATILELKGRIQANNELGNLEIYRQKLIYRPGRYGMDPLADNLTLFECGIGQIDEDPIEVDLLLEDNLLEFSPEIIERVIVLLRNSRTEELTNLLSQYTGTLMITSNVGQYYRPPIDFDPASRWLVTLANALRENTTVTRLIIPNEHFLDEDFISLTDALKQNTNITSLTLTAMNIGDNHIIALAEALKVNRTITDINLSRDNFGDDGATALADALKSNNTITRIELDGNRISNAGAAQLADALKSNNTITYINLSNNKIGDVGAIQLVNVLKENTTVMHFSIYRNMIINRGQNALRELHALRPELTIGSEYHVELW